MKLKNYIVYIILMCYASWGYSYALVQDTIPAIDTLNIDSLDLSTSVLQDSLSHGQDSTPAAPRPAQATYRISPDAIDQQIKYGATDSSVVAVGLKKLYLYGAAFVEYEKSKLEADYIEIDFDKKLAVATFREAYGPRKIIFSDGEQNVEADKITFNFETSKGLAEGSKMREGEFEILGGRTKFVKGDSLTIEDRIFQKDAFITTCDADHKHYGIRTRKIKVIPDRLAVIGFSQLVIADVPTPFFLPFGMFPLVEGQSSGLIFPRNYEYNDELGFGLRGIGYYFPINDYMDLTVLGDIYTRGTHRIALSSRYKKRYKYDGDVTIEYANNIGESRVDGSLTSNKSFRFYLAHKQDPKAHPYRSMGGNIDIQTGNHQSVNYNDYNSQVRNILTSNFYYRNSLPDSPFSLDVGINHSQNTLTNEISITLPDVNLNMQTIYPFQHKNRIGPERWYEKINLSYGAKLRNSVNTVDSTLFTQESIEKMVSGLRHEARTAASFKAFKYFTITPGANFEQIVTAKTLERYLNPNPVIDTIGMELDQNGDTIVITRSDYEIDERFNYGIKTLNKFRAGVTVNTQIFGTKLWDKGWLRGIRHTIKPSISINYRNPTDHHYRFVDTSLDPEENDPIQYNQFQGGAFSSSLNELQLSVDYGISNFFEAKYWSKKDEREKKFKLLRQLDIRGSYNYQADSLKWSPLNITGNTNLFNGLTSIRLSSTFDFYKYEEGRRVDRLVWDEDNVPLEFNNFEVTINNGFTVRDIIRMFEKSDTETELEGQRQDATNQNDGADLFDEPAMPDNEFIGEDEDRSEEPKPTYQFTLKDFVTDFRFTHSWRYRIARINDVDTAYTVTHTLGIQGSIPITDNWSMDIQNIGYDLKNNSFVYPSIGIRRDLHCWQMSFSWQPERETYSFFIGVKSSQLSFLKYNYGQRNASYLNTR